MAARDDLRPPAGDVRQRTEARDESVGKLSDAVLEEELTIAACAPGRLRFGRYQDLLEERRKRHIAAY
jgi:hypothetical protein